jgi:hypothetical protein
MRFGGEASLTPFISIGDTSRTLLWGRRKKKEKEKIEKK